MCYTEIGLRRLFLPLRQLIICKKQLISVFSTPVIYRGFFIYSLNANRQNERIKKNQLKRGTVLS